ncbi:hypothetical protein COD94_24240 [Bacillus cereus]|nr:hypothetical protein COD94_24240 [Bacillus cereus]
MDVRKWIKNSCWVITAIAIINLIGLVAPTWLLIATLISIALFIYEKYSNWNNKYHVLVIVLIFVGIGGILHLHTGLDAFLKGVKLEDCPHVIQAGFFTGGCGVDYDISLLGIGEHLNDTLSLGALAWAISFYVKREGTE